MIRNQRWFVITGCISALALAFWVAVTIPARIVANHQRSTTRELAAWEAEYSKIHSVADATRTAQMLRYVQTYYVVGDGYRSEPQIEAALEDQRQRTTIALLDALRQYTGQDFGLNPDEWLAYLSSSAEVKPSLH